MAEDTLFDSSLTNPEGNIPTEESIRSEIDNINEDEYLTKVRAKNKKKLVKLGYLERERVGKYIQDLYESEKSNQDELAKDLDEYDDVWRMLPTTSTDSDMPNYRSWITTVNIETIHASVMNVFFTPKNILRVIPVEAGDVPKVKKLDIFGNWSMQNEMFIHENCDRLFHASAKNGECPYIVHWVKEVGTDIKVEPVMNPARPSEPLIDEVTKEPITQEREVTKILYNGPKLEIFSRKDYIIPSNSTADKLPDWEMRRVRLSADTVNRREEEGEYYPDTFDSIGGWGQANSVSSTDNVTTDADKDEIPLGRDEKIFVEFYGRLRIESIKNEVDGEEEFEELEDEFIAVCEVTSGTLCSLKKNKFPLKMRPTGMDMFIPDDEGRLEGTGVVKFMDGIQTMYDALMNQYIYGVVQSNSPPGFFTPMGNMRNEPIKVKSGYMYPTSDPNSVKFVSIPPPNATIQQMMSLAQYASQVLFGVSDYAAGVESQIDPEASGKKAEAVIAAGSNRFNLILQRKNKTLKDIFRRWFLLYQANMPANKFMRIAGEGSEWKFDPINMQDFDLKAIPDFELVGNVMNSNKTLEANKAIALYKLLVGNPFFAPNTQQGMQSLHSLTKYFLESMDVTGASSFLPPINGDMVHTPEEENARFMQGDTGEPADGEDHVNHIRVHTQLLIDPSIPEDIKKNVILHIQKTSEMLKQMITKQMVMSAVGGGQPAQPQSGGLPGGLPQRGIPTGTGTAAQEVSGVLQGTGMGGPQAGV